MNRKMLLPPLGLLLVAGMILPAIAPARAAVLPLKVSADNLDEATTAELTKAIADKFARYPSLTLLPMPEADAIDVMIDAGCEDLNTECLVLIGKQYGATAVLYSTAVGMDEGVGLSIRYVEVESGKQRALDRAAASGVGPSGLMELALGEILGPEPSTEPAGVLVNFVSFPPGGEVYIGTEFVGIAPVSTRLSPGSHDIRMVKEGYRTRDGKIDVAADKEADVKWSLSAIPAQPVIAAPVAAPTPAPTTAPTTAPTPAEPTPVASAPATSTTAATTTSAPASAPTTATTPATVATTPATVASKPATVASIPSDQAAVIDDVPTIPQEEQPVSEKSSVSKQPFYKTWWFWTIIGVAVVGAGTAAGVLATQGEPAGGSIGFSPDPGFAPLDVTIFR